MCSVGLGVLTEEIPPEFVDEVVELSGCREKRHRLLPARAVVSFVVGLCLFSGAGSAAPPGYRSVMRWLTNGLRHLHGLALPTSSALTKARQRLGSKPLWAAVRSAARATGRTGHEGRFRVRAAPGRWGRHRPGCG
ncbi:transposase domain-containing protein [Nonomuraea fuscirosea]|uniref:transposase domain-containing protein n=1 Tax=Nonomuraea fuscirosea TaxID=1291556 RepID=UPI000D053B40